jgi:tetratricopeptide (TPR) repeat protein
LLYLKRLDEARSAFLEARRSDAQNHRAKVALGAVAFLEGDLEQAIRIYENNLHLLPKKDTTFSWPSHALNNLGWCYINTGRYLDALLVFQRLKSYHPKPIYPSVFNGLGWAYLHLKRTGDARSAFEEALKLDPKNALALNGLSAVTSYR